MLTFLVVSSGGGGWKPGREQRSFPTAHFLPPFVPSREGGRCWAGSPTAYPTWCSGLGGDITSSAERLLPSPLPCRPQGKQKFFSSWTAKQSVLYPRRICRYEQSKLHRILVLWYRVCARVCACACAHFCFLRWVSLRNIARRWWGRDLSTVWFLLSYDTHIHSWTHIHRLKYVSTRQGFFCKNVFITPNKSSKITEWKT